MQKKIVNLLEFIIFSFICLYLFIINNWARNESNQFYALYIKDNLINCLNNKYSNDLNVNNTDIIEIANHYFLNLHMKNYFLYLIAIRNYYVKLILIINILIKYCIKYKGILKNGKM